MSIYIQDLEPGNEVKCWMRLGLALKPTVNHKGDLFYAVPPKPTTASSSDLTRFLGWVIENETDLRVITLHISPFNSKGFSVRQELRRGTIAYSALQRVRKYSLVNIEPNLYVPGSKPGKGYKRPGQIHSNSQPKPFRKLEEVIIK